MSEIYSEIKNERKRQDDLWGEQNHPIIMNDVNIETWYDIPSEKSVKICFENKRKVGMLSYFDILLEEVVEVANCKNKDDLRKELIQVAAVTVAMIESLERNGK